MYYGHTCSECGRFVTPVVLHRCPAEFYDSVPMNLTRRPTPREVYEANEGEREAIRTYDAMRRAWGSSWGTPA